MVSEGFDKCEVIPGRQGPTKLKRVLLLGLRDFQSSQYMLHYKMACPYHIKMATHFTAAVWLEVGLA